MDAKKHCNENPIVKWSRDWPHHVGHWWLYRGNRTTDKISLVRAAIDGSGKIMVMSPAEILYCQEQTSEWYFAPAILPDPPMSKEQMMTHLNNGGQLFRTSSGHRFFYKIENEQLMCRVNELGCWNPAVSEPRWETDNWQVSEWDWEYNPSENLITKQLPPLKGSQ